MSSLTLTTIQTQLDLYTSSVLIILGTIGNMLIVIIFSRHRQNACSIYLSASAIINSLFLILQGVSRFVIIYYNDETMGQFAYCKLKAYLLNILGETTKTMLVLACIDRFLITHGRASFRVFSTPKRAKYAIVFSIIFWSFGFIHVPIMQTISNGQCTTFGIYSTIFAVFSLIVIGSIPPIFLGIFSYLTYRNIRRRNLLVQPIKFNTGNANNFIRQRDRDLIVLIISEILLYLVTTTPYPLMLVEMMISTKLIPHKSIQYSQIESFILNVTLLLVSVALAAPFYIYWISSKSFRRDFKQILINGYQKIRRQTNMPVIIRTNKIFNATDSCI